MRPRKKKHCAERMEKLSHLFFSGEENFNTEGKPLSLEIGCGKGSFICGMAAKYPGRKFVGIEKVPDVLVMAMEKANEEKSGNVSFLAADAEQLCDIFRPESVEVIYLNFSDPWPKKKHAKRRLTYRSFLDIYKKILVPGGRVEMKTDNDALFDFSLDEISNCGFEIEKFSRDLPPGGLDGENIITEYESNFRSLGKNINYLRAKKK